MSFAAQVTVVIVIYNSRKILLETLPRLAGLPHVLIADNGSTDDGAEVARQQLPLCTVLRLPRNLGFGRANNAALRAVTTPYALLLNPDCLLEPGALDQLVLAAQRHPDAAILAPKLFDAPGRLGLCYRPSFYKPQPSGIQEPAGDLCSDFLTGAAMLLRMNQMKEVGFFDPWFFLYFEDDDLCLRTRKAGYSLVLVNDAVVYHKVRQSSAPSFKNAFRRDYCLTLSKFYILGKYFGAAQRWGTWARVLAGSLLTLPLHLVLFNRKRVTRSLARLSAALMAPRELTAKHCYIRGE